MHHNAHRQASCQRQYIMVNRLKLNVQRYVKSRLRYVIIRYVKIVPRYRVTSSSLIVFIDELSTPLRSNADSFVMKS